MSHHLRGLHLFLLHQRYGGAHIVGIAAGGADVVSEGVMHIVKIDRRAELLILRAGEKVQAAVRGQQRGCQSDELFVRDEDKNIVKTVAAGERHQRFAAGVVPIQIVNQRLRLGGIVLARIAEFWLIGVGDHQQRRVDRAMQRVVDSQQTHRARAAEDQGAPLRANAHHMVIAAFLQMIVGVERADDAGKRLHQRTFKPGIAFPGEQAILRHHLVRDHHVGGFAADPREGITGAVRAIR